MRWLLCIVTVTGMLSSCKQSDPPEPVWELVWSDEFEGNELDESVWEIQKGDGSDYGLYRWGNNEQQYYQPGNISLQDGILHIKVERGNEPGYPYYSGRIRSILGANFRYGKIEAAMKVDTTSGLWSAFWMLPTEPDDPWPESGEIDIMEHIGNDPSKVLQSLHFADQNNNQITRTQEIDLPDNLGFHTYAVTWNEREISWSKDGVVTFTVLKGESGSPLTWPFDNTFHILLNVAVGGNLGGIVNEQELAKGKKMSVDYVRVYQLQ